MSDCNHIDCERIRRGEIIMVPVHVDLLRQMVRDGWSAPVQVRIDPDDRLGWEMTCRLVSDFDLVNGGRSER